MARFGTTMLEAAARVGEEVGANAIFINADTLSELKVLKNIDTTKDIILFTRDKDLVKRLDKEAIKERIREVINVPSVSFRRLDQIKLSIIMALATGTISDGDRIVCVTGVPDFMVLDTLLVIDIGREFELITSTEISKGLTGQIKPEVFEAVLGIAIELSHQGREGKPAGTIFVVGDHKKVIQLSRQLIMNPFKGYPEEERNILDRGLHETIKEFSSIDGAFSVREDGVVVAAGLHLDAAVKEGELPQGLGSRHMAAAGITAVTDAIAITVSESTGAVRIFRKGKVLIEIEKPTIKEGYKK